MINRHIVPPEILTYIKLHLYPPDGSSPACEDPYITIPAFCDYFRQGSRSRTRTRTRTAYDAVVWRYLPPAASGVSIPPLLVRKALKILETDGFLRRRRLPKRNSEGDLLLLTYPLPNICINIPSLSKSINRVWYKRHHYAPGGGFKPGFFYTDTIIWEKDHWAYCLRDNWWFGLIKRSGQPKKKHLDKLKKRIPKLVCDWDGIGYEILVDSDSYTEFGMKHGLRMNPQDDDYNISELMQIWQNLKHPPKYECPLCGAMVTFKHDQRSKRAKHEAKLHKPECDLIIVSEIMDNEDYAVTGRKS